MRTRVSLDARASFASVVGRGGVTPSHVAVDRETQCPVAGRCRAWHFAPRRVPGYRKYINQINNTLLQIHDGASWGHVGAS